MLDKIICSHNPITKMAASGQKETLSQDSTCATNAWYWARKRYQNGGQQDAKCEQWSMIFFFLLLKYVIIEVSFKLPVYRVTICECTRSFLEASCQKTGCSFVLHKCSERCNKRRYLSDEAGGSAFDCSGMKCGYI